MTIIIKHICLLVIFIIMVPASWGFAQEIWTMDETMRVKWSDSTAISPDNQWVAYTVYSNIMEAEISKVMTHIWISALEESDESRTFQLTTGEESCFEPLWSPNGEWIAFLSARLTGNPNIWLIRPNGGEAIQLTDVETGVEAGSKKWSHDSKYIAFLMKNPQSQKEKKAVRAKIDPIVLDSNWKYKHIYTVKVEDRIAKPQNGTKVTNGDFDVYFFDWSPGGKRFVIAHKPTPVAPSGVIRIFPPYHQKEVKLNPWYDIREWTIVRCTVRMVSMWRLYLTVVIFIGAKVYEFALCRLKVVRLQYCLTPVTACPVNCLVQYLNGRRMERKYIIVKI
jgi:WD40-like Beta Propeller Repeat